MKNARPIQPPNIIQFPISSTSIDDTKQQRLTIVPCTIRKASAFIAQHHRHHRPPQGALFAVAVADEDGNVRGAATIGMPVARMLHDGFTAEVTRVATDGCPNACSALYGAAWRAARALGYRLLITYILESESGTSLRASGYKTLGQVTEGRSWDRPLRSRKDKHPIEPKVCYERRI